MTDIITSKLGVTVIYQGKNVKVDAYLMGRSGRNSPASLYFKYKGRWISPYEQEKRGWSTEGNIAIMSMWLKHLYSETIQKKMNLPNPFLDMVNATKINWSGLSISIPA